MSKGSNTDRVTFLAEKLNLLPHPEGGFYKETYRCEEQVISTSINASRNISTGIYFLIDGKNFSAFHRIKSDEMWHHYEGSALTVAMISPEGAYSTIQLGKNIEEGEVFQAVVPAGYWFGSYVEDSESYALVGCTVAPGFDFADFEMAERDALVASFPQHRSIIEKLTRA